MRRPVPPIAELLATPRRIRDGLVQVLDWIDAGTRTLQLPTRTPADEDVAELVTPTGVRYRAPRSIFTGPAGPEGPAGPPGTGGGGLDSPWWPLQDSDPWNEEFDTDEPDLANLGWTVVKYSGGATMTRAGDVFGMRTSGQPPSGQYNSTWIGSTLWLQTHASDEMFIYKTFSADNYLFGTKVALTGRANTGQFPLVQLVAYTASRDAANPDRNTYRVGWQIIGTKFSCQTTRTDSSGSNTWSDSTNIAYTANVPDVLTIDLRIPASDSSGYSAHGLWESRMGIYMHGRQHSSSSHPQTATVVAGVRVSSGGGPAISGGSIPTAVGIDWIRRQKTPMY